MLLADLPATLGPSGLAANQPSADSVHLIVGSARPSASLPATLAPSALAASRASRAPVASITEAWNVLVRPSRKGEKSRAGKAISAPLSPGRGPPAAADLLLFFFLLEKENKSINPVVTTSGPADGRLLVGLATRACRNCLSRSTFLALARGAQDWLTRSELLRSFGPGFHPDFLAPGMAPRDPGVWMEARSRPGLGLGGLDPGPRIRPGKWPR